MKALALAHVSLTVSDLTAAEAFYTGALGFTVASAAVSESEVLARLLGADQMRTILLRRGGQTLELCVFDPPGLPYPPDSESNDLWFQHCALVTDDIGVAYAKLNEYVFTPISREGPQVLPGGVSAFKFRDGDGHPLELIQFAKPDPATAAGIDHTAISVPDIAATVAFYSDTLGLLVAARQLNTGPAQASLDRLDDPVVDVVAMTPGQTAPHLELLGYRAPLGRAAAQPSRSIAATRSVFLVDELPGVSDTVTLPDGTRAALIHDPDGHALLLLMKGNGSALDPPKDGRPLET